MVQDSIEDIILDLQHRGILETNKVITSKMMKGTTEGVVYILKEGSEAKHVLKFDSEEEIKKTERFLTSYHHVKLLPDVIYTHPERKFIIYSFLSGTTHVNRGKKVDWMSKVVTELLNHYVKVDQSLPWGSGEYKKESWAEYNLERYEYAGKHLSGILTIDDFQFIEEILKQLPNYDDKYLIHGDNGVHNFVFEENQLKGVIDPSTMVGPVIYDFTYAFCSSPDDLDLETLRTVFTLLHSSLLSESQLINEVIFQLFCRIDICSRVHPEDLQDYLKAWNYWKTLKKSID
ncbi:phosphotransferase [Bacillus sp. BGMRC 2118]|nr:phosphotransferase [Bacillus sp. BGMRC 2118]